MKQLPASVWAIAAAAFLAPLLGGQVTVDRIGIEGGAVPFLQAAIGGLELPTLSHSILAIVLAVAVIAAVRSRTIVQAPKAWFFGSSVLFFGLLLLSIGMSQFRYASLAAAIDWLTYAVGLFATVACVGRGRGPTLVLQALVAGCALLAVIGLKDWAGQVRIDPGYRLTGGWINPNAFAGMMAIGALLGIALPEVKDRLGTALRWLAVGLCVLALMLTGSRAGLYGLALGLAIFAGIGISWRLGPKRIGLTILAVIVAGAVGYVMPKAVPRAAGASQAASARALGGGTGDDSAQFRKNLFLGAIDLVKSQPLGRGIGTYRYYSAQSGLTTQTQYTHNNLLQAAVEVGIIAALVLVGIWFGWAVALLRPAPAVPPEQNSLRLGVLCAAIAVGAQGMLESNLSYFGIGLTFHILLGVGVLIAPDAIAPEYLTKTVRTVLAGVASLVAVGMVYVGVGQYFRARAFWDLQHQVVASARENALQAISLIPVDADSTGLLAQLSSGNEALGMATRAAELGPSTVALRRLARLQAAAGMTAEAIDNLERARKLDPNNLLTLTQLLGLYDSTQEKEKAVGTARTLVAVEATPYFQIRALADIVPTETFQARVYLASLESEADKKASLLRPAVAGFVDYAKTTVPWIVRTNGEVLSDENPEKAARILQSGTAAAAELEKLYRAVGDEAGASFAAGAIVDLEAATKLLSK